MADDPLSLVPLFDGGGEPWPPPETSIERLEREPNPRACRWGSVTLRDCKES